MSEPPPTRKSSRTSKAASDTISNKHSPLTPVPESAGNSRIGMHPTIEVPRVDEEGEKEVHLVDDGDSDDFISIDDEDEETFNRSAKERDTVLKSIILAVQENLERSEKRKEDFLNRYTRFQIRRQKLLELQQERIEIQKL